MFVQSVTKQTGSIKIKNQGWVKTQAGINNLIKAGILEVEIDPDKTLIDTVPEKDPIATPTTKIKRDPWQKINSAEQEMGKAKKLYDEAKHCK